MRWNDRVANSLCSLSGQVFPPSRLLLLPTFIFKRPSPPPPPLKIQANQTTAKKGSRRAVKIPICEFALFPAVFAKTLRRLRLAKPRIFWPCVPLSTAPSFPLLFGHFFKKNSAKKPCHSICKDLFCFGSAKNQADLDN